MTNQKLKASIIEQIKNLDESDLVNLNNTFCQENGYSENEIYRNDEEFFNTFFAGRLKKLLAPFFAVIIITLIIMLNSTPMEIFDQFA